MFDKVSHPQIYAYDGVTNQYLGRHVFKITPEIESILLDYAHHRKMQERIVIQGVDFYPDSADYTMPLPYEKQSRRGIFRAMFRDQYSLQWVPVEIHGRFNFMGRVPPEKDEYHFDSIEYSDIVVEKMRVMTEQITYLNQ